MFKLVDKFNQRIIMYHIDRHPTKELRKRVSKVIIQQNSCMTSTYTVIGFELYQTDDIDFAYEIETFDEVKELLKIAKKDPDYKYTYFLKQDN